MTAASVTPGAGRVPIANSSGKIVRGWLEDVSIDHLDTVDPTVTDDVDAGYEVGNRWLNTTTFDEFLLIDETAGSAVWELVRCPMRTTALTNGVLAIPDQVLVDDWGTVQWELQASNLDGRRFRRTLSASHDGTAGADATAATVSGLGHGAVPAAFTYDVDVDGAGASQYLRLRLIVTEDDWTVVTTRLPQKAS
jgi:hypothetical protein